MAQHHHKEQIDTAYELALIAREFCALMEKVGEYSTPQLLAMWKKFLPLLYLKGSLLPEMDLLSDIEFEHSVSEDEYEAVRQELKKKLNKIDTFWETENPLTDIEHNVEKYSLSEYLTDIYQDLKNFISLYHSDEPEARQDAIYECRYNFYHDWGLKIPSALRIIHLLTLQLENEEFLY